MSQENDAHRTLGLLAEDVYNDQYLFVNERFDGYEVLATSPESSNGFQSLLLKKIDSNVEGSQYVFAFRGTQVELDVVETWRALIQTDVLGMGLQNVPGQFLEAIM